MLVVHLFVSFAHVNLCHFFSSSWYRELAATSACGSSWTFLFTFFHLSNLFKNWFTLACFHRLGKIPELKLLSIIMVMLDESTFETILSNLGPIQSSPVALVVSRFDNNFLTKATFVSGILKYVSRWTFEFT